MKKDYSLETHIIALIAIVALFIFFAFVYNSCNSSEWNNGKCPKCNVRYELRTETRYHKTYVCPECGNEVSRY